MLHVEISREQLVVTPLRIAIALLALIAATAGLLIEQPEVFAFSSSAALLIFLIGCGAIAADALPLKPVPLVCSVLTVPLAVLLFRPFEVTPVALAILVLQGIAWWATSGRRLPLVPSRTAAGVAPDE